jgi:phage FluMu protein Com
MTDRYQCDCGNEVLISVADEYMLEVMCPNCETYMEIAGSYYVTYKDGPNSEISKITKL